MDIYEYTDIKMLGIFTKLSHLNWKFFPFLNASDIMWYNMWYEIFKNYYLSQKWKKNKNKTPLSDIISLLSQYN